MREYRKAFRIMDLMIVCSEREWRWSGIGACQGTGHQLSAIAKICTVSLECGPDAVSTER